MKRHTPLLSLLLAASTWTGAAHAQPTVQPGAELVIDGKSTVRDFTCRATKMTTATSACRVSACRSATTGSRWR